MSKASKIVSSSILGLDWKTIVVAERVYTIKPPTIEYLAAAGHYLSDIGEGDTMDVVLRTVTGGAESAAKALSCFICGNDSLYDELKNGTFDEIVAGLDEALSLISADPFVRLSGLTRSVANLIAKAK